MNHVLLTGKIGVAHCGDRVAGDAAFARVHENTPSRERGAGVCGERDLLDADIAVLKGEQECTAKGSSEVILVTAGHAELLDLCLAAARSERVRGQWQSGQLCKCASKCDASSRRTAKSGADWKVVREVRFDVGEWRPAQGGSQQPVIGGLGRVRASGRVSAVRHGGGRVASNGEVAHRAAITI